MIGQLPPFALSVPRFRFRALASRAGHAALGGEREVALACLVAARLGAGLLPPFQLAPAELASRAASGRQWLASISIPARVRTSVAAAIDASAGTDEVAVARALAGVLLAASEQLDEASFGELRGLVDELAHDSSEFAVPELPLR